MCQWKLKFCIFMMRTLKYYNSNSIGRVLAFYARSAIVDRHGALEMFNIIIIIIITESVFSLVNYLLTVYTNHC